MNDDLAIVYRQIIDAYRARDFVGALGWCRKALAIEPGNAELLSIASSAAVNCGEIGAARHFAEALVAAAPDRAEAHLHLGHALAAEENHAAAAAAFRRATDLDAGSAGGHLGLGVSLHRLGRAEAAVAALEQAVSLDPKSVIAGYNLGNALFDLGRLDAAMAQIERTLEIQPGHVKSLLNKANIYRIRGDAAAALEAIERALARHPDSVDAHFALAKLKTFCDPGDADLARITGLADRADLTPAERINLAFALAKANDDLGRYDQAFADLDRGNRLVRSRLDYAVTRDENFQARIVSVFRPELLARLDGDGYAEDRTIFIVGMPRSGTTLVEQILASHDDVHGGGEVARLEPAVSNYPELMATINPLDLHRIGRAVSETLLALTPDGKRLTDKTPANFWYLGLIAAALPNARIIHCRRDPVDTCFSCYRQLFADPGPGFAYDFDDLARYYAAYARTMAHWRRLLGSRILDVAYEDVVADTEGQARRIVGFCDLQWRQACLNFHATERDVHTASNLQVRRPVYGGAVGYWRRYEKHLGPLLEALQTQETR